MKILIACEFSQIVTKAFRDKGHEAYSCDLLETEGNPEWHIQADFRSAIQDTWDFVGYHYECKVMANCGARWLYEIPGRWEQLDEATEVFNITLRDTRPGYSENPIQHKHTKQRIDREQDQVVQPWYFGDPYFKATCLWLRDISPLKDTNRLIPPLKRTEEYKKWSMVHRASPGKDRWKERSRAFPNFSEAMANQWG